MVNINSNIFSILVQRNLARATQTLSQSYERLSSGERINRSADDPAGLARSELFRYEIQGLRQVQANISGSVSLIGTAESYLDSIANMLQRARELAVQAGNETLRPSDREAIQNELTQLLEEIDRIAGSARFNDQSLLDGTLANVAIQVGVDAGETMALTLGDSRTAVLGARALRVSAPPAAPTPLPDGAVSINGIAVPASAPDGVSTAEAAGSALALAAAINRIESRTGVHARALATELAATSAVAPIALNATSQRLEINGVLISGVVVSAGDADGALVQAINARSGQTGVTASVDATGRLTLRAADGRNIRVVTTGGVGGALGLAAPGADIDRTQSGRLELSSTRPFTIADPGGMLNMGAGTISVALDPATALAAQTVSDADAAGRMIEAIDAAIAQIGDQRARVGAISNRLEALTDTLARRIEDLSAADSRIRDTDFALETTRLTQAQILQEAAVAMLAQANIAPQRALQLLQPR